VNTGFSDAFKKNAQTLADTPAQARANAAPSYSRQPALHRAAKKPQRRAAKGKGTEVNVSFPPS